MSQNVGFLLFILLKNNKYNKTMMYDFISKRVL